MDRQCSESSIWGQSSLCFLLPMSYAPCSFARVSLSVAQNHYTQSQARQPISTPFLDILLVNNLSSPLRFHDPSPLWSPSFPVVLLHLVFFYPCVRHLLLSLTPSPRPLCSTRSLPNSFAKSSNRLSRPHSIPERIDLDKPHFAVSASSAIYFAKSLNPSSSKWYLSAIDSKISMRLYI